MMEIPTISTVVLHHDLSNQDILAEEEHLLHQIPAAPIEETVSK